MNITFLLPCTAERPVGGIKVIFEYANRFIEDGYCVNIIMPARLLSIKNRIASLIRYPYYLISKNYLPYEWFELNKNVKLFFVRNLKFKNIPCKSDIFIATAVETAYFLEGYDTSAKKIYFIQDFEDWSMSSTQVLASYKFKMTKIVISPWLKDLVRSVGEDATLIPNGFDFNKFFLQQAISKRNKYNILMLYHKEERKRCKDAIKALCVVKKKYPCVNISMFGVPKRPRGLPFEFSYFRKPNKKLHNDLYNNSAIFVSASRKEGMALPPAEAMQCGCALCCTNIGGFSLYAKDGFSALLSPVYDYEALAKNIIKLLEDDVCRQRIAKQGNELIQGFTWEKAYRDFKNVIMQYYR